MNMNPSHPLQPLDARIAQILSGPSGPDVGAFFDFDGTLIDGFSAAAYLKQRMRRRQVGLREASEMLTFALNKDPSDADFDELIRASAHRWRGIPEAEFSREWQRLFARDIAAKAFPEAWKLVLAHKRMGHTVVIASSATRWQILPAAQEFGISHVLATPMEVRNGLLTGRLAGPALWNQGKANAVASFSKEHRIRLDKSYGYANGDEDIPFLSLVKKPCPINPRSKLLERAEEEGWPVLEFEDRRHVRLEHRIRTVACYTAMATTFLCGWAAHRLGTEKRAALNFISETAPGLGLSAAGIKLRVQGNENLWKARPAVFIFNHQSPLDLVIGFHLMQKDASGVVKKEAGDLAGWGQFLRFVDAAFVDRANPDQAKEALAPAVEKLKQGRSLGICPEGTRSYSPRLGEFKKGAFHMAMQAGVPIIPVVMRNVGDVMHRDAAWMRPGIVDICVLPPIPTSDWTTDTLNQHVKDIHKQYVDTLENWPDFSNTSEEPLASAA